MPALDAVKFLTSRYPTYLIFWVTAVCNSRCSYCFNIEAVIGAKKRNQLTFDEIERMARQYGHIKYITMGGGEPSLRPELYDIVKLFHDVNGLRNLTIVSNGLTPARIEELVRKICTDLPDLALTYSVSIDGMDEEYDRLRGTRNGFPKVVETVKRLRAAEADVPNLMTQACGVYNKWNEDTIVDTFHFVNRELQVPFNWGLVRNAVQDKEAEDVDLDRYERFVDYVLEHNYRSQSGYALESLKHVLDQLTPRYVLETARSDREILPCKSGTTSVVITDEGDVLPCEMLPDTFGNLRDFDYDLRAMLDSDAAEAFRRRIAAERCHCTWECATRNNIVFNPKAYPRVLGQWLKNRVTRRKDLTDADAAAHSPGPKTFPA